MQGTREVGEAAARRLLRIGLGWFWLLDAALLAQPGPRQMDMLAPTMVPAASLGPPWLSAALAWWVGWVSRRLETVDGGVAALEVAIGLLLVSGRRPLVGAGALLSVLWGLLAWVGVQGLGGMLGRGATLLGGAPGSMLLAALCGGLLLSATRWRGAGGRHAPTALLASVLLLGGLLQLQPRFWTGLGLAQPFAQAAMMPQPSWLRRLVGAPTALAFAAPVPFNLALVGAMLLGALGLWRAPGRGVRAAVGLGLLLLWLFGEDMGQLLSGMAVDPGSAPLLGLLLAAGEPPGAPAASPRGGGASVPAAAPGLGKRDLQARGARAARRLAAVLGAGAVLLAGCGAAPGSATGTGGRGVRWVVRGGVLRVRLPGVLRASGAQLALLDAGERALAVATGRQALGRAGGRTLVLRLPPGLPPGRYAVLWHARFLHAPSAARAGAFLLPWGAAVPRLASPTAAGLGNLAPTALTLPLRGPGLQGQLVLSPGEAGRDAVWLRGPRGGAWTLELRSLDLPLPPERVGLRRLSPGLWGAAVWLPVSGAWEARVGGPAAHAAVELAVARRDGSGADACLGGVPAARPAYGVALPAAGPVVGLVRPAPGWLVAADTGGVLGSADGGLHWRHLAPSGSVAAFAAAPADPRVLYAATARALWRSRDGGRRWRALPLPPGGGVTALAVAPGAPLTVYAAGAAGLAVSRDGGARWRHLGGPTAVVALAVLPSGPRGKPVLLEAGAVHTRRSRDGGRHWAVVPDPVAEVAMFLPLPPGSRAGGPRGAVLAAGMEGGVARSSDGGRTWQSLVAGLPPVARSAMVVAVGPRGSLYLGGMSGGIFRWPPGGRAWQPLGCPEGAVGALERAGSDLYVGDADGDVLVVGGWPAA